MLLLAAAIFILPLLAWAGQKVEVTKTVEFGKGELVAQNHIGIFQSELSSLWELDFELNESGLLSWTLSTAAPLPPAVPNGDVFTVLIGDAEEDKVWGDCKVYGLQEFTADTKRPFIVSGKMELTEPCENLQVWVYRKVELETFLQLLKGDHTGVIWFGRLKPHISLATEKHVSDKSIMPVGDNRYRYRAWFDVPVDTASAVEDEYVDICVTFFDAQGWAIYSLEYRIEVGVILGDELLEGYVSLEEAPYTFCVFTDYTAENFSFWD